MDRTEKTFSVIYGLIGIGIIALWVMLIGTNQVPEFETEPVGIVFHIVIEMTMGLMAILTAITMWKRVTISVPLLLFTNGMLAYSVINSSGYYGDNGEFGMIGMFAVILGFVLYTTMHVIQKKKLE